MNCDLFKRDVEKNGEDWADYEIDTTDFVRHYMDMHNNRCNIEIAKLFAEHSGEAFDWYEELMPEKGEDGSYDYRSMIYYDLSQPDTKYKTYIGTVDFTYQSWAQAGHNLYQFCVDNGADFHCDNRNVATVARVSVKCHHGAQARRETQHPTANSRDVQRHPPSQHPRTDNQTLPCFAGEPQSAKNWGEGKTAMARQVSMLELTDDTFKSSLLERMVSRTTNSYKLYWLQATLDEVLAGSSRTNFARLAARMVAGAWHLVNYFRLSLGPHDQLRRAVALRSKRPSPDMDARLEEIARAVERKRSTPRCVHASTSYAVTSRTGSSASSTRKLAPRGVYPTERSTPPSSR